ncbi:B-type flagellar hook-associated protein 2 [Dissulfurispira thermophila]|uniref:Flagellar hook-associated protein 2 n=2 Tax=root TaxID=1 RepID=A0A7G1H144_9BACT|nr:flagellar filament capping protein FliD [Dissulfurispira thermophila]BCB95821.1 B-type flagellar hook-associated protein 2 [Dissulfurispira thermophila]
MSSIVDTSLLNFSLTNSIYSKYTQVQKSSYIKSIQSKEDAANTKISALGKLLNSLEELKTSLEGIKIESLKIMKTEVSDKGILTATASSSAAEGLYSVKVDRTAKSHTLYSKIYPDENSVVGTGTLTIRIGDNIGIDLDITESRKTLSRIKDALNASNANINASLLKETSGYRLVISAKDSGDENKINIIVSDDDLNNADLNGLSALSYDTNTAKNLTEFTPPYNAILFADSNFFEKAENKITDAITGITMKLLKEDDKFPVYITVSEDQNSLIFEKLNSFVEAYNNTVKLVDELRDTSSIMKRDSSVGYLRNSLTGIQAKTYNNSTLESIGFKFDTKDIMSIDIGKMNNAMISNLSNITTALNSLAEELETTVNSYIDSIIPNQQDIYRTFINEYIKAEKVVYKSFNR